jgi:hypothetical protein
MGPWTGDAPTSCDDPQELNIWNVEWAFTSDHAEHELAIPCGAEQLHHQLHRDTAYIVAYSIALSGFAYVGTKVLHSWRRTVARWMVVGGLAAGVLDLIENFFLNRVADGHYGAAKWATIATAPKWLLAGLGVLVGLVTIAALFRDAVRGVRHPAPG